MHSTRRGRKMPKQYCLGVKIWFFTPCFIWGWDIPLQIFYPFIDLLHKMHKINLHCSNCMCKGKLRKRKYWFGPLIHLNYAISFTSDRFYWKLSQIMHKWSVLTKSPRCYTDMQKSAEENRLRRTADKVCCQVQVRFLVMCGTSSVSGCKEIPCFTSYFI